MHKTKHSQELASNERFSFGENWNKFLFLLDEERINQAITSLQTMLKIDNLEGKSFLDIGSGSGLFSLAARRLGAKVVSFDYDPQSVACTQELKRRYYHNDNNWIIKIGSVLDKFYLDSLGKFDIVYSWGVLHHTGALWQALENVDVNVAQNGKLFISLYNDQGLASRLWKKTKKAYISLPKSLRWIIVVTCYIRLWGPSMIKDFIYLRPFNKWRTYKKNRGMSPHVDVIDWIGGYPFEVSRPDEIFEFYKSIGYELIRLKTCAGRLGCNEFIFQRNNPT